jgi:iron complex outermembrane receptor protein
MAAFGCWVLGVLAAAAPLQAATLAGRVVDAASQAPVAGVEVRVAGAPRVALTDADGRFELGDVPAGEATVSFVRIGYEPAKRVVVAAAPGGAAGEDTSPAVDLLVALQPLEFREDPIVVTATRVQRRESPVPHAALTREDLDQRYATEDMPVLLSSLPSSIYYSDSGNGIGYTYLTLRGFDQRRVSVLVNGVPQNDPEDQNVYWLDFPDLAANTQDVQVQRGAGSGFYGPAAIGGSVNLVTTLFQPHAGVRLLSGGGTFGTRKYAVEANSGLVNGTYAFYGRYSKLLSDGYRHDSWVDFTSYFLGAARYDERMSTRLHVYGGPIQDGLAYYGVPKEALADREARRQNVLAPGEQVEAFSQPHYELLHDWRPNDRIRVANTLFYIQGDGFFDFDASWADTTYLRLTTQQGFHPVANPTGAQVRAWVGNRQGGWLPRVDLEHDGGTLSVGAELRVHRSEHWGKIRFAQSLGLNDTLDAYDPERKYYSYDGGKDIVGGYAHEVWRVTPRLQATGDLQVVYNRYRIDDEAFVGTDLKQSYVFVNPRAGVNYNFTDAWHGYGSYGHVQREPRLKNLYDAAESSGGATPQYEPLPGGGFDFDSPLVHPERLHDVELGAGYRRARFGADANLFWMDFRDELVRTGELDRFGQPVTRNAAQSLHRGVEFGVQVRPWPVLEIGGNLAYSRNEFRDHLVYADGDGNPVPAGLQLGGNEIAGFPRFVSNLRATYRAHGAGVSVAGRYVGEFFTTNFEDTNRKVTPHFVLDADLTYDLAMRPLERARLRLQVRNVLDRLYVLHGEGDAYFPAATRNVFAAIEVGF